MATLISMPILLERPSAAPAADTPTLSDAVAVLEKERSAAEHAVILATAGRKDIGLYVRGIQLYADAKAEFDGLIAALRIDLIEGRNPAQSQKFAAALQGAAEKRIAFTNFVSDQVVGKTEGAKAGLADVVKVVPDLVKAITDAGLAIWDNFRKANKERRDAILNEIDHLRWRSFADLAPKPGATDRCPATATVAATAIGSISTAPAAWPQPASTGSCGSMRRTTTTSRQCRRPRRQE